MQVDQDLPSAILQKCVEYIADGSRIAFLVRNSRLLRNLARSTRDWEDQDCCGVA